MKMEMIGLDIFECEKKEEFIKEVIARVKNQYEGNKKKIQEPRFKVVAPTHPEDKMFLVPKINRQNEEAVYLENMSPDDIEEVLAAIESESLDVEIKRPLNYKVEKKPEMTVRAGEFIKEMKEIIKHERKIGKDRYVLRVTKAGDQEAYLKPIINPQNLDLLVAKGLSADQGEKIAKAGENLKIEVKRPLRFSSN